MAGEGSIQLNYQQAIAQARKLESLAEELRTIANTNLNNTISDLSANWNGDSAAAFIAKAVKARDDILANVSELNKAASVIRESAENIKKAEDIAKKMAEFIKKL